MSGKVCAYNFHGLVTMQVIDHAGQRGAPLVDPFLCFQVDALPDAPDITLELGEFEPRSKDCYLVDHKYHVRPNYLYCEDGWRKFHWQVEIEGFESGPTIVRLDMRGSSLRSAVLPGLYSRMLLTRQMLAQKLREQDCVLAHAAGAAREGNVVLLFGRGGSYKTSVLMSLLRSDAGWRALGDDGVILKGKQALSFPTYPGLFSYRLANKEGEHLTSIDRLRYMLKPLAAADAGENFTPSAEIVALVEIRAGGVNKLMIEEVTVGQNLVSMEHGMRLEQHNSVNMGFNDVYPCYVESYSYIFPENALKAANNPGSGLSGKGSYRLHFPMIPSQDDLIAASSFLNEIVSA